MPDDKIVLLHWDGRFGNRRFQYAFVCSYAHRFGLTAYFPSEWEGNVIFEPWSQCRVISDDTLRLCIIRPEATAAMRADALRRYKEDTGDEVMLINFGDRSVIGRTNIAFQDLDCMYLTHCFKVFNTCLINRLFAFNAEVVRSDMYQFHFSRRYTYDVVHIRCGDIAQAGYKGAHSSLSMLSYNRCLQQHSLTDLVWVSDNESIRTFNPWHNSSLGHCWRYLTGEIPCPVVFFDFMPDFLTLVFGRTIVRSNSSFSWWACQLSRSSRVFSPVILAKLPHLLNSYYEMDAEFIQGNQPAFMDVYDDIYLGQANDECP